MRIGLWDTYGGSMASGWIRWLLEQFEFPYELVFAPQLDAGDLASRFDALVFVGGLHPACAGRRAGRAGRRDAGSPAARARPTSPTSTRARVGRVTAEKTDPRAPAVRRGRRDDPGPGFGHRSGGTLRAAAGERPGRKGPGRQGNPAPVREVLRAGLCPAGQGRSGPPAGPRPGRDDRRLL
ncbi:MAG: hypothetical protein M0C28_47755 [Candidatus Moduliflexus flocculans]|nr:hypothetical protein [Candidatus Moduliflexus flocculans]